MISKDMIHSLYIPAFRVKEDLVPRYETYMWFVSNRVGTYDLFCAEYCGVGHSKMTSKVIVMPEKEFEEWYKTEKGKEWVSMDGGVLIEKNGCLECHSTDGSKRLGPTLKGVFGKERIVVTRGKERKVKADDAYLRKSILEPDYDVVKGFQDIMPSMEGVFSKKELDTMIIYMKDLR